MKKDEKKDIQNAIQNSQFSMAARPNSQDSKDSAYEKVNEISFQHNFKALIGHYTGDASNPSSYWI